MSVHDNFQLSESWPIMFPRLPLDGPPFKVQLFTDTPTSNYVINNLTWSAPPVLVDINDEPLEVGDRVVWASKAPRNQPHPRAGMITRINEEAKTVTARADLPKSNRGQSSTLPAGRVMKVISMPALPAPQDEL